MKSENYNTTDTSYHVVFFADDLSLVMFLLIPFCIVGLFIPGAMLLFGKGPAVTLIARRLRHSSESYNLKMLFRYYGVYFILNAFFLAGIILGSALYLDVLRFVAIIFFVLLHIINFTYGSNGDRFLKK